MQKADLITRAVAGFVDLLLIIGLAILPDILGFLSAMGYILIRDGLFEGRSVGKKLIGLQTVFSGNLEQAATYRESIIRNVTLSLAYLLFLIPYAGWILGPLVLGVEGLTAVGDTEGMRIGDMLAQTCVLQKTVPQSDSASENTHQTEQKPGAGTDSRPVQDYYEPEV